MHYQALYRRFRPRRFDEVVGQTPITTTLQNQVKGGTISHAYLFSGTRGTGKTSTAQIFARAINCLAPVDGEACGCCDACLSTASPDIIEIDAASNNGVDEIRDLRENVRFAPLESRHKVYIVDEVHMLSGAAFNALLKTLEEPPTHAVFILATTEPQKLPATVLSRCQRFDFHRISLDDIVARLEKVLSEAGAHFESEALRNIALTAQGGMRDALSLADQCIAFCGSEVTNEQVLAILGSMDASFLFATADALLRGDAAAALTQIDRVVQNGRDLGVFCRDLNAHMRALLLMKATKGAAQDLLSCTSDAAQRYNGQANTAPIETLLRAVSLLVEAESDMKRLDQPRVLLELAAIRICRPQDEALTKALGDSRAILESLLERVALLEQRPAIASPPAPLGESAPGSDAWEPAPEPASSQVKRASVPEAADLAPDRAKHPEEASNPAPTQADETDARAAAAPEPSAEDVFAALQARQGEAIRQIFRLYTWRTQLNGAVLEIEAPAACLPAFLTTLRAKESDMAASVHDRFPGLQLRFLERLSTDTAPAHAFAAREATPANPESNPETPLAQAIKSLFDEEKVIFE